MGDTIENEIFKPETKKKILRRPSLMAIGLLIAIGLGAFNTLAINASFRTLFPQSQTFSVGVAYSFADTQGSILLPGDTGNVSLTIVSALKGPSTLFLSFNSTNPQSWSVPYASGVCPGASRDLTMTVNGQIVQPENSDFNPAGQNCAALARASVTVQPGTNRFLGFVSVSPSATISSAFTLSWFASQ